MDKNRLKQISNSLKFEANDKVVKQIEDLYIDLEKKIEQMKSIDTDGVSPMSRIDDTPITFLREDVVGQPLPKETILNNASVTEGDFVVINKGGSND